MTLAAELIAAADARASAVELEQVGRDQPGSVPPPGSSGRSMLDPGVRALAHRDLRGARQVAESSLKSGS